MAAYNLSFDRHGEPLVNGQTPAKRNPAVDEGGRSRTYYAFPLGNTAPYREGIEIVVFRSESGSLDISWVKHRDNTQDYVRMTLDPDGVRNLEKLGKPIVFLRGGDAEINGLVIPAELTSSKDLVVSNTQAGKEVKLRANSNITFYQNDSQDLAFGNNDRVMYVASLFEQNKTPESLKEAASKAFYLSFEASNGMRTGLQEASGKAYAENMAKPASARTPT